jgi:hypothetical protein
MTELRADLPPLPDRMKRLPVARGLMGEPESMEWYCEGRYATRDEIFASIDAGLPILNEEEDEVLATSNAMAAERLKQRVEESGVPA